MNIRFHKDLYPLKAIQKTMAAYRHLSTCVFSEKGRYYCVNMTRIHKDVERVIVDEFCNYVLSLIKE